MRIERLDFQQAGILRDMLIGLSEHHNEVSEHFRGFYPPVPIDERIVSIAQKIQTGVSVVDVVIEEDMVVGFIQYSVEDHVGVLDSLYVAAGHRKKGYARQLMNLAMDWFAEKDVSRVDIMVVVGNDEARQFYERLGFLPRSEILTLLRR